MLLITRIITVMMLLLCMSILNAQEEPIKELSEEQKAQIEHMTSKEKDKLRTRIESINRQLDRYEITLEEATELKREAAEEAARRIEQKAAAIEQGTKGTNGGYMIEISAGPILAIRSNDSTRLHRKPDKRTYSDIVVAVGFNNAIQKGRSFDDSDYKFAGSRFFELGYAWRTRVFKETNFLRFKYGISLQYNNLKPTDNRFFVAEGDTTSLAVFPENLDKSKLRFTNLVMPIHFEFGPSKKIEREHYFRYSTRKQFKIGLGAYGGFRIGTKQKLKYDLDGDRERDKIKNSYNASDLIYGLSGYISWGGIGLYTKYDLNPLFESPNAKQHNISLGIRFDMD